jgi:hypothetical protein
VYATAAVWYPNAGPLSNRYRTIAADIIGEPNKSRAVRHPATLDDLPIGSRKCCALLRKPVRAQDGGTLLYATGANPVFPRVYSPLELRQVKTPTFFVSCG